MRIEKQWLYLGREILWKMRQEIMDLEYNILRDNERKTLEEIERLDSLAHAKADELSEDVLRDTGGPSFTLTMFTRILLVTRTALLKL